MTQPTDLDRLAAAHAASTPGEWVIHEEGYDFPQMVRLARPEDAHFIALAHNHWPAIEAELRQLRAERDRLREALVEIANDPYQFGARIQAFKRKARAALGGEHGK